LYIYAVLVTKSGLARVFCFVFVFILREGGVFCLLWIQRFILYLFHNMMLISLNLFLILKHGIMCFFLNNNPPPRHHPSLRILNPRRPPLSSYFKLMIALKIDFIYGDNIHLHCLMDIRFKISRRVNRPRHTCAVGRCFTV